MVDSSAKEKKEKKRLVLLDAHAILHRAYHALPDFATAKGEPTGALYGLSTMLIKIIEDLKPDYVVACYDVKGPTYRHEAYKDYKAGRKVAEDDLIAQMKRSRDIFDALGIPMYDKQGFEADDMLGTIVEQVKTEVRPRENLEIIIASGDMDTLQLVSGKDVKVYTLKKGISDTIMYDEDAVRARFGFGPELIPDYKGLRGDPSDNIIGVKGIGDKTATILITTFGSIENMYKELDSGGEDKFKKAGITPRIIQLLKDNKEEAEFSKVLATIRRDSPITFKLPEKTFKDGLDVKRVNTLWHELEFRTLTQRLEKVVGNKPMSSVAGNNSANNNDPVNMDNHEIDDKQVGSVSEIDKSQTTLIDEVDNKDEIEKVGLALWLINSNTTNPTIEDILSFKSEGSETNLEEAKKAIFEELDRKNLRKVYENIELPLIPITHKMEERGIKINRIILKELAETYHAELSRLESKIWEFAGMKFNINSPKQMGEVLFDKLQLTAKNMKKTSGGARSTRESELEKLRDLHPIVPLLFEYRELAKLLSTYIDAIPPLLDTNDRLHTDFIPSGTTTGRMASQNPNLQNIPIKSDLGKAIRNAFIAEKGFVLCGFDYSQMELRIAAFLSGDEKLIEIFKNGEDVHTSVASFVFKVPQSEVTSTMRRQAKVINFGIIYGMGVMALKQNLGTTRDEAQKFLNDYFETFSTLANYLKNVKEETAVRGYTETFFGRRRYFDGINSRIPYVKAQAERMAINAPIQGTEADVIKLAMIKVDEYLKKNKLENDFFLLLQVHDELIYEVREEKAKEIMPEIMKIMESVMDPKDTKGIVLRSSATMGNNWGELK
ncbi:MAG: DNA polymerase [Candidatus Paceibacterota bacterium]